MWVSCRSEVVSFGLSNSSFTFMIHHRFCCSFYWSLHTKIKRWAISLSTELHLRIMASSWGEVKLKCKSNVGLWSSLRGYAPSAIASCRSEVVVSSGSWPFSARIQGNALACALERIGTVYQAREQRSRRKSQLNETATRHGADQLYWQKLTACTDAEEVLIRDLSLRASESTACKFARFKWGRIQVCKWM